MGLSKYLWHFNVGAQPETTVLMISGARITECRDHSVLITYPDGVKRWIKNDYFDEVKIEDL